MSQGCRLAFITVAVMATSVLGQIELTASFKIDPKDNLVEKMFNFGQLPDGEKLDPIDYLVEDVLPPLYGQRPNNENGTRAEFKDYALKDKSNDDAVSLSGQELIARSGFKYEMFDAIADDGYITTVTHLINPLADKSKLRQPPVLMEHGGTIDPTAYLIASSIQHFPEKWPRSPEDGPIKSWNRSLAFVLVNNGFDVWLAETRGSNDANTRRLRSKAVHSVLDGRNADKNMTIGENVRLLLDAWDFWSFSQDDIIAHELKSHIDLVLKLTGSSKLHLMTFSLSTPTSLAFLGSRPDYAERVEGYVSMAPIVSGQGVSRFVRLAFETICPMLPESIGTMVFTDFLLTQPMRDLLVLLSRPPELRYVFTKTLITLGMGASPKYQTLMDLNFIGHLLRRLSFRELKQMCQQMRADKLQKYDYGPVKNTMIYKQPKPPVYDLSNLKIRDWIIVSAANDALSTPEVVDHLIKIANPKPAARFEAPGFNHADLFAGWENDKYVNFPILHYFEQMSYDNATKRQSSSARGLDFASILPPEMMSGNFPGSNLTAARSPKLEGPTTPFDTRLLIEGVSKNMRELMNGLGESINTIISTNGLQNGGFGKAKKEEINKVDPKSIGSEVKKQPNDVNEKQFTDKDVIKSGARNADSSNVQGIGGLPTLQMPNFENFFRGPSQAANNYNLGNNFMNPSDVLQNFRNLSQMLRFPSTDTKASDGATGSRKVA